MASPESSPELNPLSIGAVHTDDDADAPAEGVLAPLPEYKAAGEIVLDLDGLLGPPARALRLREDLREGCGGQTWPAGMVLARHMVRRWHAAATAAASGSADGGDDAAVGRQARILELGAGGGLVGLAVALARQAAAAATADGSAAPVPPPAPVFITDQVPMFALMEHNIALNGLEGEAKALVLNWGEPLPEAVRALRPNVILAADCVYFEPAFPMLLATLQDLLTLDPAAVVYFCFKKRRRADMHFLKRAQKTFCVTELADIDRPVFSRQGLFLFAITRREKGPKQAPGTAQQQQQQ